MARTLCLLALALAGPSLFLTWSRNSILGFAVGLITYLLLRRRTKMLIVLGGVSLCAIVGLLLSTNLWDTFSELTRLSAGTTHRTALWNIAIYQIADNPIFGYGFILATSIATPYARVLNPAISALLTQWTSAYHPHNYYFQITLQAGIPGLLIYIYFIVSLLRHHLRRLGSPLTHNFKVRHAMIVALIAAGISTAFFESGLIIGSGSYANYFWIVLGAVAGLENAGARKEQVT